MYLSAISDRVIMIFNDNSCWKWSKSIIRCTCCSRNKICNFRIGWYKSKNARLGYIHKIDKIILNYEFWNYDIVKLDAETLFDFFIFGDNFLWYFSYVVLNVSNFVSFLTGDEVRGSNPTRDIILCDL